MKRSFVSLLALILTLAIGIGMIPGLSVSASSDSLTNLFDSSAVEIGWIDGKGNHDPGEGFRTSAVIPVTTGDTVYFGAAVNTQGWHLITLDADQAITGQVNCSGSVVEALDEKTSILKYTVGEGVAYLRFVVDTNYMEKFIVTKNQSFTAEEYKAYFGETPTPASAADNLFDPNTVDVGWVNSKGETSPDGTFRTSAAIAVTAGADIYFAAAVTSQGWHLVTLDENQNVTGDATTATGITIAKKLDDTTSIMKYTVPDDTAYLRFVVDKRYVNVYLVKNEAFTAEEYYEFFGLTPPIEAEDLVNLFDKAQAEVGWINGQGTHDSGEGFYTSAPIAVTADDVVYFGAAVNGQGWHLITLDADQNITGQANCSNSVVEALDDETSILKYTVKEGTAYLRFVVDTRQLNAYVVTKNQAMTKSAYQDLVELIQDPLTEIVVDPNSPLFHKRALFCGDSISQGTWDLDADKTGTPNFTVGWAWGGRIGEAFQMQADNASIGGTSLSTIRSGRIIDQVNSKKNNTYDYVVLQGGVNDAWGDPNGTEVAEPGVMTDSFDVKDFDITTYAGGLEELFYYTTQYFPEAKIGYIITFATPNSVGIGRTGDMEPYYSVAIDICEKWGIQYLDLYHDSYVNDTLLDVTSYRYMQDAIHPKTKGYERLTPYIAQWMETMVDNSILRENHMYNKTALFCGDSISYGSSDSVGGRAWAGRIGESYHMDVTNRSVIGWAISTIRGGRMTQQLLAEKDNKYDYIILQGGVNDAMESIEPGVVTDSFKVKDFNIDTYAGGLEEFFYYVRKYFPSAKVGYIITFATPNATTAGNCADMEPYYSVGIEICKKWNIPYLDLYHNDYVNNDLMKVTTLEYMADWIHPNAKGYDQLAPYIGEWMETLSTGYTTFKAPVQEVIDQIDLLPENPAKEDEATVQTIRTAYDALTDHQKALVINYQKLEDAETALNVVLGDINKDGDINASDALLALQHSVRLTMLEGDAAKAADVTKDDQINASDALKILQYSVELIDEF